MDQSQEILLGHTIFASTPSSEYGYRRIARFISNNVCIFHSAQRRRQLLNKQMQMKFPRYNRGHPVPVSVPSCCKFMFCGVDTRVNSFKMFTNPYLLIGGVCFA